MADFRIRFITQQDFISGAIRFFEGGTAEFSHVEIILPDGTYLGAHDDGGIQIRAGDYCQPSMERRYAIPVEDEALSKMMAFAQEQVGQPYDTLDICSFIFHRDIHGEHGFICSWLVFAAALAGGLEMLNVLPRYANLITPEMLHLSPALIGHCYYVSGETTVIQKV